MSNDTQMVFENWNFGENFPIIFGNKYNQHIQFTPQSENIVGKGNDIRLKLQLSLGDEFVNILSMKAFFVNTTLKKKMQKEIDRINKFIGRFPSEPSVYGYYPDAYNVNSSGVYPMYRAYVANLYNGYGVKPDWKKCLPVKPMDITIYHSEVIRTKDPKIVIVDFPAEYQRFEGDYDLVIQAKVYDPNYKNSERTVTASYKNIFSLVNDLQDTNNPVQIEIINSSDTDSLQDVYVIAGRYNDNAITVSRNDMGNVNVDVSPITQWFEGE